MMKLGNEYRSIEVGACLETLKDLIEAEHPGRVTITAEAIDRKCSLIIAILVSIGGGLSANFIYDCLKEAVRLHRDQFKDGDLISIDGEDLDVKDIDDDQHGTI